MAPFVYTPLPNSQAHLNIRLLKLQPADDRLAPIHCRLIDYPLLPHRVHLYECLSYVWGTQQNPKTIQIDVAEGSFDFEVTQNLLAALIQLRDPYFERILWIDAVCINQKDDQEKTHQVAAMAKIYGLATRVVAWLGDEANDSAFAFEKLKHIAQQQSQNHLIDKVVFENMLRSNKTVEDRDSLKMYDAQAVRTIFALLNRPYFRRMWILQEITAARQLVYKCGEVEIQSATFVSGMEGLPAIDDETLRSRVVAFILLLQISTYRENLKGQAHLNIDTLLNLVQIYHKYHATDSRDKIFALWGLSSDSTTMTTLRPDYAKPFKDVFEELGRAIFGARAFVLASPCSQVMLVRSQFEDIGKVVSLPYKHKWGMRQEFQVVSMRPSVYLGKEYQWDQKIGINALTEKIEDGDIALFLPLLGRVVFTRPCIYYLRVVSVLDCHLLQTEEDVTTGDGSNNRWVPWKPVYNNPETHSRELPLILSWENDSFHEEQEALKLIGNQSSHSTNLQDTEKALAQLKAEALTEMANMFMHWEELEEASNKLSSLVECHNLIHGPNAEITIASSDRFNNAAKSLSKYKRAKSILVDNPDSVYLCGVEQLCLRVILEEPLELTEQPTSDPSLQYHLDSGVLMDLASKVIVRGVSKVMFLDSLSLCSRGRQRVLDFHAGYNLDSSFASSYMVNLDYFFFMIHFLGDDIRISTTELLAVSKLVPSPQILNTLIKHCAKPISNLADILDMLRVHIKHFEKNYNDGIVSQILDGNTDHVLVTPEVLLSAAKWNEKELTALLELAKDPEDLVTSDLLASVLKDCKHRILQIVEVLIRFAKPEWVIEENALLALSQLPDLLLSSRENYQWTRDIEPGDLRTKVFSTLVDSPKVFIPLTYQTISLACL